MKTKSQVMHSVALALVLSGLAWAGSVLAADQFPAPAVNIASCQQMNWNKDLLARYPWAIDACQEVVVVNGEKFARFEGHVVRQNNDGSFRTQFVNREGKHTQDWGYMNLKPGSDQHALIDGVPGHFSDLRKDQVLSFYVPENRVGVVQAPGEKIVPIVPPPIERGVALADTGRAPAMPKTAGPLPLVLLAGMASLLGALGLAIRRRASKR